MSASHVPPTPAEIVAQTVVNYYQKLADFTILESERVAWYKAQSPAQRTLLAAIEPRLWDLLPAFRRHALEVRGCSMRAYMVKHLKPSELALWIDDENGGVQPA